MPPSPGGPLALHRSLRLPTPVLMGSGIAAGRLCCCAPQVGDSTGRARRGDVRRELDAVEVGTVSDRALADVVA